MKTYKHQWPFHSLICVLGLCFLLSGCSNASAPLNSNIPSSSSGHPSLPKIKPIQSMVVANDNTNLDFPGLTLITNKAKNSNNTVQNPNWLLSYQAIADHPNFNEQIVNLSQNILNPYSTIDFTNLSFLPSIPKAKGNFIAERLTLNVELGKTAVEGNLRKVDSSRSNINIAVLPTNHKVPQLSSSTLVYTRTDKDILIPSISLIQENKLAQASRLVAQALAERNLLDPEAAKKSLSPLPLNTHYDFSKPTNLAKSIPGIPDLFRDVSINQQGGLLIKLSSGILTNPYNGQVTVLITPLASQELFSTTGKEILANLTGWDNFAGLPNKTVNAKPIQSYFSEKVDCSKLKCVALTYDDGPGPNTHHLLDELKAANVKATFLTVGEQVHSYPNIVRREVAEGHAVGCHTWNHPDLTKLSPAEVSAQINQTRNAIYQASGLKVSFTRPPYGATNPNVISELAQLGQAVVMWNVDTLDWKHRNAQKVLDIAMKEVSPGSIILMHDIHDASIDIAPTLIKALRDQGYTFVTVPELFQGRLLPGKKYFSYHSIH